MLRIPPTWVMAILGVVFVGSVSFAGVRAYPEDATLRAVQFVDDLEGWAVGDDGLILHSTDGGKSWERQKSGVRASFRSIHFLTPYSGWIAGRIDIPGGSKGVVLSTTDGGLKWSLMSSESVPGLNCVRFFNDHIGISCGDGSDAFPTGVFMSHDSGRTWKPIPGKRCTPWYAADFSDPQTGALGGSWSQMATLREGLFGAAEIDPLGGRSIRGMKMTGNRVIAVGQGGLILSSSKSSGLKWGFVELPYRRDVLAAMDFHSVAVHGKHIWIVGRPGTFVLHSADEGKTWEMQQTGQPLPLQSIHFSDAQHGWAVGEMGTILATKDSGKTWVVTQQGGQRAAVLNIHTRNRVPLETVAILGGDEGYRMVGMRVTTTDLTAPKTKDASETERLANQIRAARARDTNEGERMSAAFRAVGGTSGEALWQFPFPLQYHEAGAKELLAHWDDVHGTRSGPELLRQLVLAIRMWRPELLLTDAPGKADSPEALMVEAVKEAFKRAADKDAFPEQLETLRLSAWTAKKVCVGHDQADPLAIKVNTTATRLRLADTARDIAAEPMRVLDSQANAANECWFRVVSTRITDGATHTELMQGIHLAEGGQARRKLATLTEAERQNARDREHATAKRRTFEALLNTKDKPLAAPEQLLGQLLPATKEMPSDIAARTIAAVGDQYARRGEWILARETYMLLVERYPTEPASIEAYRWLIRYHTSTEARRRRDLGQFITYTETDLEKAAPNPEEKGLPPETDVRQASMIIPFREKDSAKRWYQTGLDLEPKLGAHGMLFVRDPAIQMCLQSARRQLGQSDAVNKWCMRYVQTTAVPSGGQPLTKGADPWRDAFASEVWLSARATAVLPPKPLTYSRKAETRPILDGKLDDACWDMEKPMMGTTMNGDGSGYTTKSWLAYDEYYMYVAVRCTHPQGKQVPLVKRRTRDDNLRGFDRVSLMIDLDRDYQTYYHFQIDQRGCVSEDCWGDRTWNPTWYAVVESDETSWTAEFAIPLIELTGEKPAPGKVWATNVVRTIPGKAIQAWSGPADSTPRPEGMGLLHFVEK